MSSTEDEVAERDTEVELAEVLASVGPHLQDAIKRGFTNITVQQSKNGEVFKPETLSDISYSSKNTQVNVIRLELVKRVSFHVQRVSLSLQSMGLELRCSLGELGLKGLYSAYNENLYNLVPVMSEGHLLVSVSNVMADVSVGLVVQDDSLSLINPAIDFAHDEVLVRLSWPSPQRNGGYEFTTTEQLAKHMEELPLTAALMRPLHALLRRRLLAHLELVLRETAGVSDMLGCDHALVQAYSSKVNELAECGNKTLDVILMNVRRTLLQSRREVLELPPLHASFTHKIGPISFVGKFETDNGWIKNLATVNRINDVTVWPGHNKTTMSTSLQIRDLKIGFDEYRIKLMGVGPSGRLLVSVGDNSLLLSITAGLAQWRAPFAQLEQLTIQYFDKLDVHITGLGPLNWLASQTASWLAGHVQAYAIPYVQRQLKAELQRAFDEINVWDIVQGKEFFIRRIQECAKADLSLILTCTCCAFLLILMLFGVLLMLVYGVSIGYHFSQKELSNYAVAQGDGGTGFQKRRSAGGDGGIAPAESDVPYVKLVAVNNTAQETMRRSAIRDSMDNKDIELVFASTEAPLVDDGPPPKKRESGPPELSEEEQWLKRLRSVAEAGGALPYHRARAAGAASAAG